MKAKSTFNIIERTLKDKRNQNNLFSENEFNSEFQQSMVKSSNLFCNSKNTRENFENEIYKQCKKCFKDFCSICQIICHKKCEKDEPFDLEDNSVYEFCSSCHCDHNMKDPNFLFSENQILSFYNSFLKEFNQTGYYFANQRKAVNDQSRMNLYESDDNLKFFNMKCKDKCNSKTLNLMSLHVILKSYYKEKNIEKKFVNFKDLIKNFKDYFKIYFADYFIDVKYQITFDYQLVIFSIHNILYNDKLQFTFEDENELFNKVLEKLNKDDEILFNTDKLNLPFTYIFYFYRKYYFSQMQMVMAKNINLIRQDKRLEMMRRNRDFLKFLEIKFKDKDVRYHQLETIIYIFKRLNGLKIYAIKKSDTETKTPFYFYFGKLFMQCYCIGTPDNTLYQFFSVLKQREYKKNYNDFNNLMRRYFDEIFYLIQMNTIDMTPNWIPLGNKKKIFDYYLFTSKKTENDFKLYLDKMFLDENVYLLKSSSTNDATDENSRLKIIEYLNRENLFYFDCFHNNFIKLCFTRKIKNKNINDSSVDIENNNIYNELLKSEKRKIFYKNTIIFIDADQNLQKDQLIKSIDLILDSCKLNLDQSAIEKPFELINYLFNCANKSIKYNKEAKLDITFYVKKTHLIDLSNMDIKRFERELKYILYVIFVLEYNKEPSFYDLLFKWNLLLFVILSNERNAIFTFGEVQILDYLFEVESFQDKNSKKTKKSFLIRSLLNLNKNIKENNYFWYFFYIAYRLYIEKYSELFFLKQIVLKNFIYKIINFYSQLTQNQGKDIDNNYNEKKKYLQINKMNLSLIYIFLKITKSLLIVNNLNSCYPYNYNVNKFKTIENMNILANLVFTTEFIPEKYLDTFKKFDSPEYNSKKSNNIKNPLNIIQECNVENTLSVIEKNNLTIEMADIKVNVLDNTKGYFRKFQFENIQVLILDMLGNYYATPDINIYFKILNENFNNFKKFFDTRDQLAKEKPHIQKTIFKLEMIILNFISNFLLIKNYDYSYIEILTDTNITKRELVDYGKNDPKKITMEIDMKNNRYKSKYLLTKMKIELFNFLENYLKTLMSINSQKERKNVLFFFFLNVICLILKEYELLSKQGNLISELEESFFRLVKTYLKNYQKMLGYEIDNISIASDDTPWLDNSFKENPYATLKNSIKLIFDNVEINEYELNYLNKKNFNFYGSDTCIIDYYKRFVNHDYKKFSVYSELIKKFITEKENFLETKKLKIYIEKLAKNIQDVKGKKKIENIENIFKKKNVEKVIKKENIEKVIKEKIDRPVTQYDHTENNTLEIKNDFFYDITLTDDFNDITFEIWKKINYIFINSDYIENLLNYLFNNLKLIEENNDNITNIGFDSIFSENFLKTINFLNNLLYYFPLNFQEYVGNQLSEKRMEILLKNVLKLNNYIIGIADMENNRRLMAISRIYFSVMDFFILLCEGSSSDRFINYFFNRISEDEEISQEKSFIKKKKDEIIKRTQEKLKKKAEETKKKISNDPFNINNNDENILNVTINNINKINNFNADVGNNNCKVGPSFKRDKCNNADKTENDEEFEKSRIDKNEKFNLDPQNKINYDNSTLIRINDNDKTKINITINQELDIDGESFDSDEFDNSIAFCDKYQELLDHIINIFDENNPIINFSNNLSEYIPDFEELFNSELEGKITKAINEHNTKNNIIDNDIYEEELRICLSFIKLTNIIFDFMNKRIQIDYNMVDKENEKGIYCKIKKIR